MLYIQGYILKNKQFEKEFVMFWFGKNNLSELVSEVKSVVILNVQDAVSRALKSFKNEEKEALELTTLITDLKKQLKVVKEELEDTKSKKKIELMEIESLVKCKEEKGKIELEHKMVEMQKTFGEKEMALMKSYHESTLKTLEQTKTEFKELYVEILNRLPNINATVEFGGKKIGK